MAYTSGFFDAVDQGGGDYDRVYSAATFAHYFSLLVKNGVFPDPSTGMQVKASSNPNMHVSVQPGSGWVNGYYITVDNNAPEQLTIPTANPSLSRIDSVIMGLNYVDRKIQLYIKSGAVSASPSAVSLQRDNDLYELELAQIAVGAGVASISQASITDMRQNTSRCGIVAGTIDQIDTTELFAQYDDAFQTWFDDLKVQLGNDVAASLQNQINTLKTDKVSISDKANTVQAEAGTDNTKWMTPALVKSLFDALKASQSEVNAGTLDTKWVSPFRLQEKLDPTLLKVTNLEDTVSHHTKELNRQAYDLYTLWLKNYYLQGSTWSPQVLGAKAILFDGFLNANYIKAVSAQLKSQQLVFPTVDNIEGIPSVVTLSNGTQQTSSYTITISDNTVSYPSGGSGSYWLSGVRVTAQTGYRIEKVTFTGKSANYSRTRLRYVYISQDGSSFTQTVKDTTNLDSENGGAWNYTVTPDSPVAAIEFWVDQTNTSGSGTPKGTYTVAVQLDVTPPWQVTSVDFQLPKSFKKATLFLSASSFTELTISPKFGTLSASIEEVSSRTDPMFSEFIEKEFDLTVSSEQAQFSIQLSTPKGLSTDLIVKRYGVYFIE